MIYQRRYILDNIINCRDLGGYPCKDGSVTQFGRFLRAGMPRTPTENDMRFLNEYGIKSVLDLRGSKEAVIYPSFRACKTDIGYNHVSLLEINPAQVSTHASMPELYEETLESYSQSIVKALKIIISTGTPFLFHCFLGKDRTGVLTMFLLHLAGVGSEDIIADYEISYSYLEAFFIHEEAIKSGLLWDSEEYQRRSDRKNILEVINFINQKYGSIDNYLLTNGMTEQELISLSNLLH